MKNRLPKVMGQVQHVGSTLSDGQLLARFVAAHDEASFATLLRRHAAMVLGVCRRVIGNEHDAEDAFQATFLILARKAAAVVRGESVGCYLHAVAYHTAVEAARANARRRARERRLNDMPHHPVEPPKEPDWRPLLDREVQRLSAKYRAAVVLCDLEGHSRKEAARLLGVAETTLSSRVAKARKLLAKRLSGRGVGLPAAVVAAALAAEAASAKVPAALEVSTARVAALVAAGQWASVPAPAAVLVKGVLKAMLVRKLKLGVAALLLVVALGAVGLACLPGAGAQANQPLPQRKDGERPPPAAADAADKAPIVQVSKPVRLVVGDVEDFTGRTQAAESVDLRSRQAGQLMKVIGKEGLRVKKGDLLFELDARPYQVDMDKANAELQRAKANVGKAARDLERAKKLQEARTISAEVYDQIASEVQVAEAGLLAAKAVLERAKLDMEYTRITAPIDGTIVQQPLTAGNFVNAGTTTLATIAMTDPMAVVFDIDERTYLDLHAAARAGKIKSIRDGAFPVKMKLANDDDFKFEGKIASVDQRVDPSSGAVRARAVFANPNGQLIPGLFARIQLATGPGRAALLIAPEAVLVDQGTKFVLVVNEKNVVEQRKVTLGRMMDGLQVVSTGLEASDIVVVRPVLRRGDEVRPGTDAVPLRPGISVRPELIVMPGSTDRKAETPKRDDK